MYKIKSLYENAFLTCKRCGKVTKNDRERARHRCTARKVIMGKSSAGNNVVIAVTKHKSIFD